MSIDDQHREVMAAIAAVRAKQEEQGGQIARLSDRVNSAEEVANRALRQGDASQHDFAAKDTSLAIILDAQKAEADKRHAETVAQLVAVKQTGATAPVIREVRIAATGLALLATVAYLLGQHIVDATQAAILLPVLAAGVVTLVKASSDKTKAEKQAAATIPPPPGGPS